MKREVAFHPRVGNFRGECPIRETGRHSHCTQDKDSILRLHGANTCGLRVRRWKSHVYPVYAQRTSGYFFWVFMTHPEACTERVAQSSSNNEIGGDKCYGKHTENENPLKIL